MSESATPSRSGSPSGRALVLVVVAAVLTLVLGGAGYAVYRVMSGGGAQPAEAIPGNAIAYLRVDLDPSAGQKVAALRLLEKFPALEAATGITDPAEDLRRRAFEEFQDASRACANLSYDDDVAPWLGDRAAVAVLPPTARKSEPNAAMVVQVRDLGAAEDGVQALARCAGGDLPAYATVGSDYLLFAETQARATSYAKAAAADPLSQRSDFTTAMERLGDQGVMSGWASVDGLLDVWPKEMQPPGFDPRAKGTADSVAVALRFDESYVELTGVVTGAVTPDSVPTNPAVSLPDSTFVALSVSGGGKQVDQMWGAWGKMLAESGKSIDVLAKQVRAETGLVLPGDLKTVLGENVTLALDSTALDAMGATLAGDLSSLRLGGRFQTDPAAFHRILAKVEAYADSQGADLKLNTVDGDNFVAVSTNRGYADQLAGEGRLGETAAFTNAVPDAASADAVLYANFDAVERQVIAFMKQAGASADGVDNVRPLASFGMSSHVLDDGVTDFVVRLTVN
jgi:hypothetical protein